MRFIHQISDANKKAIIMALKDCQEPSAITQIGGFYVGGKSIPYYFIPPDHYSRLNRASYAIIRNTSSYVGFPKLAQKIALEEGVIPGWMWWWWLISDSGKTVRLSRAERKSAYARVDVVDFLVDTLPREIGKFRLQHTEMHSTTSGAAGGAASSGGFWTGGGDSESGWDSQNKTDTTDDEARLLDIKLREQAMRKRALAESKETQDEIWKITQYLLSLGLSYDVVNRLVENPQMINVAAALRDAEFAKSGLDAARAQWQTLQLSQSEISAIEARPQEVVDKLLRLKDAKEEELIVAFLTRQAAENINQVAQRQAQQDARTNAFEQAAEVAAAIATGATAGKLTQVQSVHFSGEAETKQVNFDVQFNSRIQDAARVVTEGLIQSGFAKEDFRLQHATPDTVGVGADYAKALGLASQFKFQNTADQSSRGHGGVER
jgi:hypothetical protein